jgi:metal-sulfur cluster biosynthetic enzyme
MTTVSERDVLEALDHVLDPCATAAGVRGSIVEMGIVRDVRINESPDHCSVHVSIGVTEPTCIMFHVFLRDAHRVLIERDDIDEVTVELAEYEPWSEHDMAPRLRDELAAVRRRRGISADVELGARR